MGAPVGLSIYGEAEPTILIGTPAYYLGVLDSNAMQSVPLGFNAEFYIGVTQSILCTEWSG